MQTSFIALFLNLGSGEIFIIVVLVLLFFGADKLPQMARAFGKGMREMKNATAEIQREIEKGAVEIQRDINVGEEVSSLKEVTDKITSRITEGLTSLEEHHSDKTETPASTSPESAEPEKENPLVPPDAIKREA